MENGNKDSCSCCSYSRIYEDFMPTSELVHGKDYDTLLLNLPGFKKEELRVELNKTGILKISGQRPVGMSNKWRRFQKEFPVAVNCDRSKISAKLENGILHVKQPKMITSPVKKDNKLTATLAENTPAANSQTTTLRDEFSKQDNAGTDTSSKEEPKTNSPKNSEQTEAKSSSSSSSYSESTDDETIGNVSCLAANMKKTRKVMKMTLVALSVLGIGLYVANVMKSANEAEK
ncbi:inactive protein RESTRICTED TEV MOVEMENT 2-like isoform X1 [Solanum tuberosum]|uniref:inactive protein RESTRICTED TEV MOVEMENT 2-like isoform X1 n=1 Tax=Solanum tuberosum TaxID=4113 RepID=UPI00073A170A|nr:PREDICTED: inactive protein RESTRICTED TEV MOVEMENT 2-like isoform X1 [Solanum tuberosum]